MLQPDVSTISSVYMLQPDVSIISAIVCLFLMYCDLVMFEKCVELQPKFKSVPNLMKFDTTGGSWVNGNELKMFWNRYLIIYTCVHLILQQPTNIVLNYHLIKLHSLPV